MNLSDVSKLSPAQQKAVMADQERASAARERVMAQIAAHPIAPLPPFRLKEGTKSPYDSLLVPPAKTPPAPLSVPARGIPKGPKVSEWLPAKQLHAIPNPNFGSSSGAVAQPTVCDESLATPQGETLYSGRVHVRITSYRRRLLDPDNLTAKWFLDACRYARLIRDDNPEAITYQVGQEKVARKEDERTEIVIEPL